MAAGERKGTVLAVVQQKGGTGKTTTVATLGDALQRRSSRRILLVDLDPQASLTEWLAPPADPVTHGVEDLLTGQIDDAQKVLVGLRAGLDLLPATNGLLDAAAAIERRSLGREKVLAGVLAPLYSGYDLILVEAGGGSSHIRTRTQPTTAGRSVADGGRKDIGRCSRNLRGTLLRRPREDLAGRPRGGTDQGILNRCWRRDSATFHLTAYPRL